MPLDETGLHSFIGQVLGDLGGAVSVPLVRIGDALGLYTALDRIGPATPEALAEATGCHPRYLREWLCAQAASGYVSHEEGRFLLSPEQAFVFATPDSPASLIGAFDTAVAMVENQARVQAAFQTGRGGRGDQAGCLFCAVARMFRPGYVNAQVQDWLPALDGVVALLTRGAEVADIGCGHGVSTLLMAQAFPASTFTGYDFHPGSIAAARAHAQAHGVEDLRFEVARAEDFPGQYVFITCFHSLHDMGDPAAVAAHVRRAPRLRGPWMVVEPRAGDRLEENLNPVGRLSYSASTMICVPTSLAQETGAAARMARSAAWAASERASSPPARGTPAPARRDWRWGHRPSAAGGRRAWGRCPP